MATTIGKLLDRIVMDAMEACGIDEAFVEISITRHRQPLSSPYTRGVCLGLGTLVDREAVPYAHPSASDEPDTSGEKEGDGDS